MVRSAGLGALCSLLLVSSVALAANGNSHVCPLNHASHSDDGQGNSFLAPIRSISSRLLGASPYDPHHDDDGDDVDTRILIDDTQDRVYDIVKRQQGSGVPSDLLPTPTPSPTEPSTPDPTDTDTDNDDTDTDSSVTPPDSTTDEPTETSEATEPTVTEPTEPTEPTETSDDSKPSETSEPSVTTTPDDTTSTPTTSPEVPTSSLPNATPSRTTFETTAKSTSDSDDSTTSSESEAETTTEEESAKPTSSTTTRTTTDEDGTVHTYTSVVVVRPTGSADSDDESPSASPSLQDNGASAGMKKGMFAMIGGAFVVALAV